MLAFIAQISIGFSRKLLSDLRIYKASYVNSFNFQFDNRPKFVIGSKSKNIKTNNFVTYYIIFISFKNIFFQNNKSFRQNSIYFQIFLDFDPTTDFRRISKWKLNDFGSSLSMNFFKILGIDTTFLRKPIELWASDSGYIDGKAKIEGLFSTNDIAERAVLLAKRYNGKITHDWKQYEMLCINKHFSSKK